MPALVALLALLVLTALVWWRVLHRDGGAHANASCPSTTPTTAATTTLPPPSSVLVRVFNSTDRAGIASKVRTTLVGDGFQIPDLASNDTKHHDKIPGVAEIRYGTNGLAAAKLLLYYFPGARLVPIPQTSKAVVVSLGAKYRSVATPTAVQAAMLKAHVATTSAGPSAPATRSC